MTIKYDDTRITSQALADMETQSADDWNFAHQHCPRCGAWCAWQEVEDGGCPICKGKEVEGE